MECILDYADYVEMACEEEDGGVHGSQPSVHDVARTAWRFLDPADRPSDPFAIPYAHQGRVIECWSQYLQSRHQLFCEWWHLKSCPRCRSSLQATDHTTKGTPFRAITLRLCANCGWWDTEEELPVVPDDGDRQYVLRSIHRRAVLREFAIAGSDLPIDALRKELLVRSDTTNRISPIKLEELVASVFREYMSCDAIHVGGPRDGGIDLILIDGDRRYVVQVKRRSRAGATEPVSGIREFVGAMVLKGEVRGLFVSTAARFSREATETAQVAHQVGAVEYLELVDAKRLLDVCRLTATNVPPSWHRALTAPADIQEHLLPGFNKFMAVAMGHPDWRTEH